MVELNAEEKPKPKRRRYSKVNYPIPRLSLVDLPWTVRDFHLPCPHIHYRSWPIDRDYLTTQQQLNLLATPRGYRWYSTSDHLIRRMVMKEKARKRPKPKKIGPGIRQFMLRIWNMLTPEMIMRLKEILQEEAQMTEAEAVNFLLEQRDKAMRQARAEVLGPAPHVGRQDMVWARDFAGLLASKVTCWTEMAAHTPRSRHSSRLESRLREELHSLLGLEDEGPRTPVRRLLYKCTELMSVWLSGLKTSGSMATVCEELQTSRAASLVTLL